jgi:hypothetical protein
MMSGDRNNEGKPRMSLLLEAPEALKGLVRVLEMGMEKYARTNWRKGLSYNEIMDSMMRHQVAFIGGEDLDPESGLPHVDHILCNALFLSEMTRIHPEKDDRDIPLSREEVEVIVSNGYVKKEGPRFVDIDNLDPMEKSLGDEQSHNNPPMSGDSGG